MINQQLSLTDKRRTGMPTRRIFELIVAVNVLFWPARSTVKLWGRQQLAAASPGSALYTAGEVIVTVL
jgi:hypothetical protein